MKSIDGVGLRKMARIVLIIYSAWSTPNGRGPAVIEQILHSDWIPDDGHRR